MARQIRRRTFLKGTAAFGIGPWIPALRSVAGPPCDLVQLSSADLDALARGLSSNTNLLLPTDEEYGSKRLIWNRLYNYFPTAIVRAHTKHDVAFAIQWCQDHGITPRIRCGGHSFAGYCSGGTLVIDVRPMSQISIDSQGVAEIGSGANLCEVYEDLHQLSLRTLPGGTCPTVGISGLTMAGGFGIRMREHGLTIDNLIQAEIVLADGSIEMASATSNPDLFWALRGGGLGSYGVVTKWWFQTIPYVKRVLTKAIWDWSDFPTVYAAWELWLMGLPATCYAGLSINGHANTAPHFGVTMLGDQETGNALLERLDQLAKYAGIPYTNTPGLTNYPVHPTCEPEDTQGNAAYHKSRLTNSPIGISGALALKSSFDMRAADPAVYATEAFCLNDGLGGAVGTVAPTATAWVHREAIYSSQFGTYSNTPDDEAGLDACQRWQREMYAAIAPHYDAGCYQGYWDPDIENWPEMYYGENFTNLRVVKSKYDPTNFFRFQRSIPPL